MSGQTIAATTKQLICETDEHGRGLSIADIVARIHVIHPGCKTTKACVSWYLSKARKGDFDDVTPADLPRERNRSGAVPAASVAPEPTPYEAFTTAVTALANLEMTDRQLKTALTKAQSRADAIELQRLEAEQALAEQASIAEQNLAEEAGDDEPTEIELEELEEELETEIS